MKIVKNFVYLFTPDETRQAALLSLLILIMGILEMIGVLSILPFITILTNPSLVETNSILKLMFQISTNLGVENIDQFILVLGVLVVVVLLFSLLFKSLTTYFQIRFINMREYTISKKMAEIYLHQPYVWYLSRNSSELGKNILSEVQTIIGNVLNPLIDLFAKGVIAIAIISLLIKIDTKLALIVGFTLSTSYGFIYYILRKLLRRIGKERLENNRLRFLVLSQAFGAIKEIKLRGLEQNFVKLFSLPAKGWAKNNSIAGIIKQLPRYFFEAIAFGGGMLLILYLMSQKSNFNSILPTITLYVFAGYRLMPALQQIYTSLTTIKYHESTFNTLIEDIKSHKKYSLSSSKNKFLINDKINLRIVNFTYPNSSKEILRNIDLTINSKTTIGLTGITGSGKTTIVDIILGLLDIHKGTLKVDGQVITAENIHEWKQSIGYVPQNIYLADDTIASNIAFGVDKKNIDQKKIEAVSRIANLHEYVENELEQKYQTNIGEKGVRLSGGQRQRIAIARALYYDPKLLVLDEATSALDKQTEDAVMDAINNIGKDLTIILIAHRLSTLKNCDEIYLLKNGELKKIDYEEL